VNYVHFTGKMLK